MAFATVSDLNFDDTHGDTWDVAFEVDGASAEDNTFRALSGKRTLGSEREHPLNPILAAKLEVSLYDETRTIHDKILANTSDDLRLTITKNSTVWHQGLLQRVVNGDQVNRDNPKLDLTFNDGLTHLQQKRWDVQGRPTLLELLWYLLTDQSKTELPTRVAVAWEDLSANVTAAGGRSQALQHDLRRQVDNGTYWDALVQVLRYYNLQAFQEDGKWYVLHRSYRESGQSYEWEERSVGGTVTTGTTNPTVALSDSDWYGTDDEEVRRPSVSPEGWKASHSLTGKQWGDNDSFTSSVTEPVSGRQVPEFWYLTKNATYDAANNQIEIVPVNHGINQSTTAYAEQVLDSRYVNALDGEADTFNIVINGSALMGADSEGSNSIVVAEVTAIGPPGDQKWLGVNGQWVDSQAYIEATVDNPPSGTSVESFSRDFQNVKAPSSSLQSGDSVWHVRVRLLGEADPDGDGFDECTEIYWSRLEFVPDLGSSSEDTQVTYDLSISGDSPNESFSIASRINQSPAGGIRVYDGSNWVFLAGTDFEHALRSTNFSSTQAEIARLRDRMSMTGKQFFRVVGHLKGSVLKMRNTATYKSKDWTPSRRVEQIGHEKVGMSLTELPNFAAGTATSFESAGTTYSGDIELVTGIGGTTVSRGTGAKTAGGKLSGVGAKVSGGTKDFINLDDRLTSNDTNKKSANSSNLTNALAAAEADNKSLLLPPKKYYIDSEFTYDKPVKIFGEGTFALASSDDTFTYMAEVTADDVVMQGVTWDQSEVSTYDSTVSGNRGEGVRWTGNDGHGKDVTVVGLADKADNEVSAAFLLNSEGGTFENLRTEKSAAIGYRLMPGAGTLRLLHCSAVDPTGRMVAAASKNPINPSPKLSSNATAGDSSITVENWVPQYGDIVGIRDDFDDDLFFIGSVTDNGNGTYTVDLTDVTGSTATLTNSHSAGDQIVYNEGSIVIDSFNGDRAPGTPDAANNKADGLIIDTEPQVLRSLYVNADVEGVAEQGSVAKAAYSEVAIFDGCNFDQLGDQSQGQTGISTEQNFYTRRFLGALYIDDTKVLGRSLLYARRYVGVDNTTFEVGSEAFTGSNEREFCVELETPGTGHFDGVEFRGATSRALQARDPEGGRNQEISLDDITTDLASGADLFQRMGSKRGTVQTDGQPSNGINTAGDSKILVDGSGELSLKYNEKISFVYNSTTYTYLVERMEDRSNNTIGVKQPNQDAQIVIQGTLDADIPDNETFGANGLIWNGRLQIGHVHDKGDLNTLTGNFSRDRKVLTSTHREHTREWSMGRVEDVAAYDGSGAINIANCHWRIDDTTTQSAYGSASFGSDANGRYYLDLGSRPLLRRVRTDHAQRFQIDADHNAVSRPCMFLYDSDGNRLSADKHIESIGPYDIFSVSSGTFGDFFRGGDDRDAPMIFKVSEKVSHMEVGYQPVTGDNRLYSWSIRSLQPQNLDTWADKNMGDGLNQAKSKPQTWAGYPDEGRIIYHESPAEGETKAWIATPSDVWAIVTDEEMQDAVMSNVIGGENIDATYDDAAGTLTLDHAETSSQGNRDLAGFDVYDEIKLDSDGHVTDLTSRNLEEAVEDEIDETLIAGTNITLTYDDAAGELTIDASGGSSYTDEDAQDAVASALSGGWGITITYDDPNDTINIDHTDTSSAGGIDTSGASIVDVLQLDSRGHVTGLSTRTLNHNDLVLNSDDHHSRYTNEEAQDTIASALNGGWGVSVSYDDVSDIITIDHVDTSSASGVDTSGASVVDVVQLDSRGHVTGLTTRTLNHNDLTLNSDDHHSRYTDEESQDAVGTIMSGSGATTVNYDDANNTITVSSTDTHADGGDAGGTVVSDVGTFQFLASNDASVSVTNPSGDTLRVDYGVTTYTDEQAQDAVATALTGGTDTSVTYDDPNDTITVSFDGFRVEEGQQTLVNDQTLTLLFSNDFSLSSSGNRVTISLA